MPGEGYPDVDPEEDLIHESGAVDETVAELGSSETDETERFIPADRYRGMYGPVRKIPGGGTYETIDVRAAPLPPVPRDIIEKWRHKALDGDQTPQN